jgi:acyl carrier protein
MITPTDGQILADLAPLLAALHGQDYGGLTPETRFFADLGLASIDAVVLGEGLERHYGRPLPFGELMAELGRKTDRDMTLGELAAFLRRHLAGAPTQG